MKGSLRSASVVAASLVAFLAMGATADAQNKCLAGKIKCASKKKSCVLNVVAKAYKVGTIDTTKLQKCTDKFDGGLDPLKGCFEKLETKNDGPCPTLDDTAAIEAKVDAFVDDVQAELDPGSVIDLNPCTSAKLKCVRKKNKCILNVQGKAAKTGLPPDGAKLQKCKDKFDGGADPASGCFEKAEAKYLAGCVTANDTAALEAKIDAFDADVVAELTFGCPGTGDPCPTTVQNDAIASAIDLDNGWTGQSHDAKAPSMGRLTVNISGCANAVRPCGLCSVSGPIQNAGGTPFNNHRCENDTAVECTTNADCAVPGGACVFFFGPPLPLAAGGVSVCVTNKLTAPVTGTTDIEAGSSAALVTLNSRVHLGPVLDRPCPECLGGICQDGPNLGDPCTVNGVSTTFGNVSFDCPPNPGADIGNLPIPLDLRTGTQTRVLSAASPNCTAGGFGALKCQCDTCNSLAAEPCDENADCPDPPGPTGPICGGRRCVGGTNGGAACSVASECPAGACTRVGKATQPNECDDSICTPNTPPDNDSIDEGICNGGPFEQFCSPVETFRGCSNNGECPLPGDTCSLGKFRACYTDDNGAIGGDVQVGGVADPPSCNVSNPVLGSFYCIPNTSSGSVNSVSGLPGLGRVTIPSTATFN